MNTFKSVWYGWGVLIAAGGGAYFFAKREINADRATKQDEWLQNQRLQQELEQREYLARTGSASRATSSASGADGMPPDQKPIPPEAISKYESPVPFKNPRGNRFA